MNKKLPWLVAFIALFAVACATTEIHPGHKAELSTLMQNPKTAADHEAIAAHYEQDAKLLREKEREHKEILRRYELEPWLYGKPAPGYGEHCTRLIQFYGQAAAESLDMAQMHRAIADELEKQGGAK